ncbi:Acid phosphatase ues [Blomia tropicalis]|nr:Acid phosphatase ues [Blomia tropicalis]
MNHYVSSSSTETVITENDDRTKRANDGGTYIHSTVQPAKRGFFCNDESIRYPYLNESKSSRSLYISQFIIPFVVIYLERRIDWSQCNNLTKSFIHFGLLLPVIYTGMSRISSYSHHWSDVVAGLLLGTVIAIYQANRLPNINTFAHLWQTKTADTGVVDQQSSYTNMYICIHRLTSSMSLRHINRNYFPIICIDLITLLSGRANGELKSIGHDDLDKVVDYAHDNLLPIYKQIGLYWSTTKLENILGNFS